ncbi:MAG: 50S ribosomal protein L6 [Actinomycetota bacterium]|nr:50S ribosomal protein L6 [Actinomycetota bacterium]MDD5666401.1 50S ribosomal protein L6 [Actinomycetota bacterium]
MSRIGKMPIPIPQGTEVKVEGNKVTAKGPRGELTREFHPDMDISIEEENLLVRRPSDSGMHRSLHGLTRSLVANMVEGVTSGFEKNLEIHGVGYRAVAKDRDVELTLGFSHPILVKAPEGIEFEVVTPTKLRVKGIDKQKVGQMAAKIRALRKPDPYKGKGVRYAGEYIKRKAGKTAV